MTKRRSSLPCSESIHRAFRPSSARGPGPWAGTFVSIRFGRGDQLSEPDRARRGRRVARAHCFFFLAEHRLSTRLTCLFQDWRYSNKVSRKRPDDHFQSGVTPLSPSLSGGQDWLTLQHTKQYMILRDRLDQILGGGGAYHARAWDPLRAAGKTRTDPLASSTRLGVARSIGAQVAPLFNPSTPCSRWTPYLPTLG